MVAGCAVEIDFSWVCSCSVDVGVLSLGIFSLRLSVVYVPLFVCLIR